MSYKMTCSLDNKGYIIALEERKFDQTEKGMVESSIQVGVLTIEDDRQTAVAVMNSCNQLIKELIKLGLLDKSRIRHVE